MKKKSTSKGFSIVLILFVFTHMGCETKMNQSTSQNKEEILYRPNFHFTPKTNWMNDPNGMFYYKGKFHLYFQHNPEDNIWGPMHWGHATSEDLKTWEEHPIALYPDSLGTIFSGSAVVDFHNTSGFGSLENPPIVAIFTYHNAKAEQEGSTQFQTQGIAYSLDEGYSWTKYASNPVIQNPGIRDFRDPKVFWLESEQKWILTLAAGQETQFYTSKNLKEWKYASSFGEGIGNHDGVWECPDLFPLSLSETNEVKWVHLVSINPGGPNGGSATQYFVGDFDGKAFTLDSKFEKELEKEHTFWTDYGKDNYAGVTFSNWTEKSGNVLYLGWMSNWEYATKVPTTIWRSAMTTARELKLTKTKTGYRLLSLPDQNWASFSVNQFIQPSRKISKRENLLPKGTVNLSKAELTFELHKLKSESYSFILSNDIGEELSFGLDFSKNQYFIDRKNTGNVSFSETFASKPSIAPRFETLDKMTLTALFDKTSVELFFDNGKTVMTELFFPNAPFNQLDLVTDGLGAELIQFKVIALH